MMEYQGIKIYDKVIIVEKPSNYKNEIANYKGRTINQGYVVDFGNKKMLESAMNWAEHYDYDESLGETYYNKRREVGYEDEEVKALWQKYLDSKTKVEGIVHEYDNGRFEITLSESADYSNAGGKLSFWNCIITCPDKKQYLIGINSELLLHLLMFNTFVRGTCQQRVWLGRVKGNQVGAFTENMEEFAQAHKDEERRNTKKSVKYNQGDIIESLDGYKQVYLGEFYVYGQLIVGSEDRKWHGNFYSGSYTYSKPKYLLFYKPVKVHGYTSLREEKDWDKISNRDISFHDKKLSRILTNTSNYSLANLMRETVDNFRNVYDKVYVKCRNQYDPKQPYPYSSSYFAIMVRTSPNINKEEIKADIEKVRQYVINEQKDVDGININRFDCVLVEQYTPEAVGECYYKINGWGNYKNHMKKGLKDG